MYNPVGNDFNSVVAISNDRYTDLVRKEERLAAIERVVKKDKYATVADIKIVLGIEETEGSCKDEK